MFKSINWEAHLFSDGVPAEVLFCRQSRTHGTSTNSELRSFNPTSYSETLTVVRTVQDRTGVSTTLKLYTGMRVMYPVRVRSFGGEALEH